MKEAICKGCGAAFIAQFAQRRFCNNDCKKPLRAEYGKKYAERTKEMGKKREQQKYSEDPDRYRAYHYKHRYGLTIEAVEAMYKQQGMACGICKKQLRLRGKRGHDLVVIDHCHASGKVRALLCHPCNLMIGYSKDNPETLAAAIEYLGRFNE